MTKHLIGLVMAALLLSTVGCGQHPKGIVQESLPRAQRTRSLAVGDKTVYNVSIGFGNAKEAKANSKQGTVTVDVRDGFKHGNIPSNTPKTFHVAELWNIEGNMNGQISWMGQDSEGTLYLLGRLDQGKDWALVKDKDIKPDTPAVMEDGSSWGYTMHLSDGKIETDTYKIVGIEKVKTPAGEFEAYKTSIEAKMSNGDVVTGYSWLRPEFPRGVKVEQVITSAKRKIVTHVSMEMKSYKLAD